MIDAPCEWPLLGCDDCTALASLEESPGASPGGMSLRDAVEAAAVEYVWRWSGRGYGTCEVTVRPCRRDCHPSTYSLAVDGAPFHPVLIGGDWWNVTCGVCGSSCSCTSLSEVVLPGPVASVSEVLIDGAALDPSAYRVDNWTRLVRVDGGSWPVCQNLSAAADQPDTFEVTYLHGQPVPKAGQLAAGTLACELAKAVCGDDSCALSGRVQEVTREGVTMILMPPDIEKGETGLWIVDSFIRSQRAPRNARVVNPDLWLRQRRQTS